MAMRQIWLVAWIASVLAGLPAMASCRTEPVGTACECAGGTDCRNPGAGSGAIDIRNLSTIAAGEVPAIRRLLEQDLKGHGVLIAGAESANAIRITLSENERERVWVAEIVEGNETRVAMVQLPLDAARAAAVEQRILLRKERYLGAAEFSQPGEPVLAALETSGGLVVLEREEISFFAQTAGGWKQQKSFPIGATAPGAGCAWNSAGALLAADSALLLRGRSARAAIRLRRRMADAWGSGRCVAARVTIRGRSSRAAEAASASALKAFYNAARDYFTGVVTPSHGSGSAAVLFCGTGSARRGWGGAFADGN